MRKLIRLTRDSLFIASLAATCFPLAAHAQDPDWAYRTTAGTRALDNDDFEVAIIEFREALELSRSFRREDLRRPTAIRNLAHVYTMAGEYEIADSLYLRAIATASSMLAGDHDYMLNLREEHKRLREAMRRSMALDPEVVTELSLYEKIAAMANRTRNITTIQSGPALPVTSPTDTIHSASLLHIGTVRVPLGDRFSFNLSRVAGRFPAKKHRFYSHLTFRGIGFGAGINLGKWTFDLGGGPFSIRNDSGHTIKFSLITGVTRKIWDGSANRTKPGYYLDLGANFVSLPVAPGAPGGAMIVGLGLSLGYFD